MKKYKNYKQTGIDWIGEIPENWSLLQISRIADGFNNGMNANQIEETTEYPISRIETISSMKLNPERVKFIRKDEVKDEYLLEIGDILLSHINSFEKVGNCAIYLGTPKNLVHGVNTIRLKSNKKTFSKYLLSILQSSFFRYSLQRISKHAVNQVSIPTSDIKQIKVPFTTDANEQYQIAVYIRYKTSLVDNLISKNNQLIKLLEEKKQATINQAVTKGLDPNVKMKDSGIEWIGEIPEHWEVIKLKRLVSKIGSGITPRGGSEVYRDRGIKFLRSQNIQNFGLDFTDIAHIPEDVDESMKNSRVLRNDVLLNITGASIGRVHYYDSDSPANVNQHVCIIRPITTSLLTKFLYLILLSQTGQTLIELNTTGSGREGLNFESISNFEIVLPNQEVQDEIISFLFKQIENINNIKNKLAIQNTLLQEYRQALISNAVTGKIDVRDEPIPEEYIKNQTL